MTMKILALTTLLAGLLTLPALADTPAGWHALIVGDSLAGWVDGDGKAVSPGTWKVADGVLHLTGKGGGNLYSAKKYGDFELIFEWKIAPGGNSGVKYRMAKVDGRGMLGPEYQVLDDGGKSAGKGSTASLYDLVAPDPAGKDPNPVGKWNRSRVVVKGSHIRHFLNGRKVVDITVGTAAWKAAVAKSKFANLAGFAANPKGPIMLQDHGSMVWFRAIRIREL